MSIFKAFWAMPDLAIIVPWANSQFSTTHPESFPQCFPFIMTQHSQEWKVCFTASNGQCACFIGTEKFSWQAICNLHITFKCIFTYILCEKWFFYTYISQKNKNLKWWTEKLIFKNCRLVQSGLQAMHLHKLSLSATRSYLTHQHKFFL